MRRGVVRGGGKGGMVKGSELQFFQSLVHTVNCA